MQCSSAAAREFWRKNLEGTSDIIRLTPTVKVEATGVISAFEFGNSWQDQKLQADSKSTVSYYLLIIIIIIIIMLLI